MSGRPLECSFLIPIRGDADLSAGDLHPTDRWNWLIDEIFVLFEGGTRAPGLWEGFYADPDTGSRVPDESRKYIVAVPREELDSLRSLLEECSRRFYQKCIYLSIAGEVEFIANPDIGSNP